MSGLVAMSFSYSSNLSAGILLCFLPAILLPGVISRAGLNDQVFLFVGLGSEIDMPVGARLAGLIGRIADVVLVAEFLFDVRENLIQRKVKAPHLKESAAGLQGDLFEYFLAVRHFLPASARL